MKKAALAVILVVLIIVTTIVAGILLVSLAGDEAAVGKLYTYPVSAGGETYLVSVRSNYSSPPEVSYFGIANVYAVSVDFRGDKENAFCNITVPADLIWGEISVIDKYYKMSADRYILSSNGTHNSVYFTFNHPALVKHFEVTGTEGIPEVPSS